MTNTLSQITSQAYASRQVRRVVATEQLVAFRAANRIRTVGMVASVAHHTMATLATAEAQLVRNAPTADLYLHTITQLASLAINQRLAELTYE